MDDVAAKVAELLNALKLDPALESALLDFLSAETSRAHAQAALAEVEEDIAKLKLVKLRAEKEALGELPLVTELSRLQAEVVKRLRDSVRGLVELSAELVQHSTTKALTANGPVRPANTSRPVNGARRHEQRTSHQPVRGTDETKQS